MAAILLPRQWTKQPQSIVGINQANPLTRGLRILINNAPGDSIEKVTGTFRSSNFTEWDGSLLGMGLKYSSTRTTDYTSNDAWNVTGDLTVVCGFRTDGTGTHFIGGKMPAGGGGGTNTPFALHANHSTTGDFTWNASNGAGFRVWQATGMVTSGESVVAAVSHGSTGIEFAPTFFKNGIKYTGSITSLFGGGGSGVATGNTGALRFGDRPDAAASMTGQVAFFAVWDRILSDQEHFLVASNFWQLFAPLPGRIFVGEVVGGTTDGVGSLSATGTLAGTGASTFAGVGSLAATGTIAGVGASIFAGVGSLSATGTIAAVGADASGGIQSGDGALSATGTIAGVGASTFAGVGSLSATGTISAVGADGSPGIESGVGSLSATGTIAGVGASIFAGVGSLTATGTLTGVGADAISAAVGALSATATLSGVSDAPIIVASGPAPAGSNKRSYRKRYILPDGEMVVATQAEIERILDELVKEPEVVKDAVETLKTKTTKKSQVVLTKAIKYEIADMPVALARQVIQETLTEDLELEAHAHYYIQWERDLITKALERLL